MVSKTGNRPFLESTRSLLRRGTARNWWHCRLAAIAATEYSGSASLPRGRGKKIRLGNCDRLQEGEDRRETDRCCCRCRCRRHRRCYGEPADFGRSFFSLFPTLLFGIQQDSGCFIFCANYGCIRIVWSQDTIKDIILNVMEVNVGILPHHISLCSQLREELRLPYLRDFPGRSWPVLRFFRDFEPL